MIKLEVGKYYKPRRPGYWKAVKTRVDAIREEIDGVGKVAVTTFYKDSHPTSGSRSIDGRFKPEGESDNDLVEEYFEEDPEWGPHMLGNVYINAKKEYLKLNVWFPDTKDFAVNIVRKSKEDAKTEKWEKV